MSVFDTTVKYCGQSGNHILNKPPEIKYCAWEWQYVRTKQALIYRIGPVRAVALLSLT